VTYDVSGKVINWSFARTAADATAAKDSTGMQALSCTFVVGPGVSAIEPRWSGSGPATVRLGAVRLERNPA